MGWAAGEWNIIFSCEDSRTEGRNLEWEQEALTAAVVMFCRVGLSMNIDKTKAVACTIGFIWGQLGKYAYMRREMGEGALFRGAEKNPYKLRRVWGLGGGIFREASHGTVP